MIYNRTNVSQPPLANNSIGIEATIRYKEYDFLDIGKHHTCMVRRSSQRVRSRQTG